MSTPAQQIGMPNNPISTAIIDKVPRQLLSGSQNGSNLSSVYNSIIDNSTIPIYASGALSAGVLKNILQVYASGVINFLALGSLGGTERTIRLRLTIDGVVVYDATSSSGADRGLVAVGAMIGNTDTSRSVTFDQIPFSRSFAVDVSTSDASSTNYVAAAYRTN